MQIQYVTAKNFKSLVDFRLDLAKFTCLTGLNGSGKSTVLQFMDFLGQQVRGNIEGWLDERGWEAREVLSKFGSDSTVEFSVACRDIKGQIDLTWAGSFDSSKLYCISERIIAANSATLEVQDGRLRIEDLAAIDSATSVLVDEKIAFSYQGSVLSQLRQETIPEGLRAFTDRFRSLKSLDLLSPERLRQRNRDSAASLGLGGNRLSALLHQMGPDKRRKIARRLGDVYKQLQSIESLERDGWKKLAIQEGYGGRQLVTEARHMNDGMLRLIAILAELDTNSEFLLFDEIENGINPEVVETVVTLLASAKQQVVATTHSPMILNYLDDAEARAGVMYLYKTRFGQTKAIPFFSIPSLAKKLAIMGPGEAFVDTDLTALADEIAEVTGANV
jgi:predicted ATPase